MKKRLETIHYSLMVLTDLSPLKQLILSKLVEEIDDLLRPVPTEWRIKGQAQKFIELILILDSVMSIHVFNRLKTFDLFLNKPKKKILVMSLILGLVVLIYILKSLN